jgi:hypothetical protein
MAIQKGIVKIKGNIGGLSFFQRNGKDLIRISYGPSKTKVANDPAFIRTKENNQEFSGAAIAGKAARRGLIANFDEMADYLVVSRMLKLCKEIISKGTGLRGQRSFAPSAFKESLLKFIFKQSISFDSIFLAPYTSFANAGKNEVTITIPDFNTRNSVNAPADATHFKIINLISVLSEYNFNVTSRKYEPLDAANNSLNAFNATDYLPIGTNIGSVTSIVATLPGAPVLNASSVLISCIGIEFYQSVNGMQYLLASGNAMKIKDVF